MSLNHTKGSEVLFCDLDFQQECWRSKIRCIYRAVHWFYLIFVHIVSGTSKYYLIPFMYAKFTQKTKKSPTKPSTSCLLVLLMLATDYSFHSKFCTTIGRDILVDKETCLLLVYITSFFNNIIHIIVVVSCLLNTCVDFKLLNWSCL